MTIDQWIQSLVGGPGLWICVDRGAAGGTAGSLYLIWPEKFSLWIFRPPPNLPLDNPMDDLDAVRVR